MYYVDINLLLVKHKLGTEHRKTIEGRKTKPYYWTTKKAVNLKLTTKLTKEENLILATGYSITRKGDKP